MMAMGTLYGVGVGPGDPELITVKAYRIMKEADVIAYPKKRKGTKSYAFQIVEAYVDAGNKEMLGLAFPMTKDEDILTREWNAIVDQIFPYLQEGKDVAFVTEGDPMLYSTFIHLQRLLNERYPDIPIVSIPGVSSVNGAASRLGIPLADGDEWMAIVPATADCEKMKQALETNDAIVFIKVAKVLGMMIELLEELDLLDKASVATKVTSKDEWIWRDIRELRHAELEYLTLMIVKK